MLTNLTPKTEAASKISCIGRELSVRLGGTEVRAGVFMAPLSGITDVPFRRLVRSFGTRMVYSEMVASGEILKGDRGSLVRAQADGGGIHAVQLAGRDPGAMRAAATFIADGGADLIDINMGCPAKKVVGGLSGSALMRDLDLALRLIEATIAGAGRVPVSVKMRLGWDCGSINAPELARRAEAAGVQLVTVHGRTRDQFYEGRADWAAISAVKDAVSIPVVANGDLVEAGDEGEMRRLSRADAVMVGRGACGRPWFPALLDGCLEPSMLSASFADLVVGHYEAMLDHYGETIGTRHARKHLGWYLDRFASVVGASLGAERAGLLRSSDTAGVRAQLYDLLGEASLADMDPAAAIELKKAA